MLDEEGYGVRRGVGWEGYGEEGWLDEGKEG